jgi:hypothetical protein
MIRPYLSADEVQFIDEAVAFLETPSSLVSVTNYLGKPLDRFQNHLPEKTRQRLHRTIEKSLKMALKLAIETIRTEESNVDWEVALHNSLKTSWAHTALLGTTGAIGGALGTAALIVELPLSTTLMLRGISSVAKEWGHDLRDPEVQLQCLYVFTLGSERSQEDDQMDSAYLSSRIAFQQIIRELAGYLSQHSVKDVLLALEAGGSGILLRFLALLIPSFEKAILQKFMSRAVPVVGAIGGAALNAAFSHYFTRAARYHFGILHLEKKSGTDVVEDRYRALRVEAFPPLQLIS